MNFLTGKELINLCNDKKISDVMLMREANLFSRSKEDILNELKCTLDVFKSSIKGDEKLETMGGLIGGESKKLNEYTGKTACGLLIKRAITYALRVLEVNTSMGVIVAAPTAGSAGVLPAGILAIAKEYNLSDDEILKGMLNASAIGYLVSLNATVAGAEGGCQAEIGTAAAMTASAITEMLGGTPTQCLDAAATVFANMLGLVCDPILGLVEAPCQKRNASGVANALICAEMSLAGISHIIPFDEMVETMFIVGKSLPESLRETADGGMAASKTACKLCKK